LRLVFAGDQKRATRPSHTSGCGVGVSIILMEHTPIGQMMCPQPDGGVPFFVNKKN
jgi:hypothetical protein